MDLKLPWLVRDSRVRVAVIGDIILDEYLDGSVSRISPEAPVPVHLVRQVSHSAGGAANAARNISLAGGEAHLFGVCGTDEASQILIQLLKRDGVTSDSILCISDRPTHRKSRVRALNQQLVRIDWEKVHPLEREHQHTLLSKLAQQNFDAILISDYGKGLLPKELLSAIFAHAQERKIPCVVDPKGSDFSRYKGAKIMTPNLRECCVALGIDEEGKHNGEFLGRRLQDRFDLEDILVTMGAGGMIYVPRDLTKPCLFEAAQAKEVYDVSGAGDTVAAILTLGLGAQAEIEDLVHLTNTAAAIVVAKWGTQAVTSQELEQALEKERMPAISLTRRPKIFDEEQRSQLKQQLQSYSQVVFTNGCFDLLHAGHVDYLEKAKQLGDCLVIGINTDESISALKGTSRPIVTLLHRMKVLAGLECVDYIIPFSEQTPLRLIQELAPHVLVKGADYKEDEIVGSSFVKSYGGSVHCIELVPGLSSTKILERLAASQLG